MRISAIIFDLDGTLIDSMAGIQWSADHAVWQAGLKASLPPLRQFIGPPIREMLQTALPGIDAETLDRAVLGFRKHYDAEGWRKTTCYDQLAEILGQICRLGIACFIASNKPSFVARSILRQHALEGFFRGCYFRDSRDPPFHSKTELAEFIIRRHGLESESTLLVGDCRDDYDAAVANGLRFIHAAYGYGDIFTMHLPATNTLTALADLLLMITADLETIDER